MFKVGQPFNADIMEHFPSPLPCHLQHRCILQSNANSATTQQKQGWQEEGMLKTDFNKSCYKTLGPVHKGELRSHSPLWKWELGSPDEVQSLELSFALCHSDLTNSDPLWSPAFLSVFLHSSKPINTPLLCVPTTKVYLPASLEVHHFHPRIW